MGHPQNGTQPPHPTLYPQLVRMVVPANVNPPVQNAPPNTTVYYHNVAPQRGMLSIISLDFL